MRHGDFAIGMEFVTDAGQWRCTDVGTRTVTAIYISSVNVTTKTDDGHVSSKIVSTDSSWFNGPPYAVAEKVLTSMILHRAERYEIKKVNTLVVEVQTRYDSPVSP